MSKHLRTSCFIWWTGVFQRLWRHICSQSVVCLNPVPVMGFSPVCLPWCKVFAINQRVRLSWTKWMLFVVTSGFVSSIGTLSRQLLVIQYRARCQIPLKVLPFWGFISYGKQTHRNFPYILDGRSLQDLGLGAFQNTTIQIHTYPSAGVAWLQHSIIENKCIIRIECLCAIKYFILWNFYFRGGVLNIFLI